jgi:hypothetical protein
MRLPIRVETGPGVTDRGGDGVGGKGRAKVRGGAEAEARGLDKIYEPSAVAISYFFIFLHRVVRLMPSSLAVFPT